MADLDADLSAEQRAAYLRWPEQRNCDWECPWPSYCVDCHGLAFSAMWDARRRLVAFLTGRPIDPGVGVAR